MILTLRYRVKNLAGDLNRQARAVNFVWNYCNDAQRHAVGWGRKWLSGYELINLTSGTSKDLGLLATTINAVCARYDRSRRQHRRRWLRYRGRKSLGWVPLRAEAVRPDSDGVRVGGKAYRLFMSRPIEGVIKDGSSFSRDARGRWYLNLVVEVADRERASGSAVGIDLGLKDLAALSTWEKISNPRHYRALEARLGKAQRARKSRTVSKLCAKIMHARRDHLHKESTRLANQFSFIAVGNVNAAGLAKTSMAKSVHDAGWGTFRKMLAYKAIGRGGTYEEVDERFTTQICSACGCTTGPKGVAELGIREWCCSACGSVHDRDHNSALNILRRSGHRPPVEGAAA